MNFIEEILDGKAPLQHPQKTEREVLYGLRQALKDAGDMPYETGLTGRLCDVADALVLA